jgi:Ca2+-binding EF-hand superfamily protein
MRLLATAAMLALGTIACGEEEPQVAFTLPGNFHLGVAITTDGQPPRVAWDGFLKQYFDYFDADGNGHWNKSETQRALPLPKLTGKGPASDREQSLDFDRLDANSDGKATAVELRDYFQREGFAPAVGIFRSVSSLDEQLGELFRATIDENRDGNIAAEELTKLARRLRKHDLNEDEYIGLTELLGAVAADNRQSEVSSGTVSESSVKLQLEVGNHKSATWEGRELPLGTGNRFLFTPIKSNVIVFGSPARQVPNVKSSGEFVLAQLEGAVGTNDAIEITSVESDPALGGLLDLFPFADRNGDAELTAAELKSWLSLIDVGLVAQVRIALVDRGENLFPLLDADADGRLSASELAKTAELCSSAPGRLPHVYQLECGTPTPRTWGGVTIPTIKAARSSRAVLPESAGWFPALDQNADGVVSLREFLGPPKAFSMIDYNGDGLIQPDEAARHK